MWVGDKRTVIDPSHSLRMTPYRLPHHRYRSFAAAQDDVLWSSSSRVQILHVRLWWRLTFPSLWRVFPKSSFRTEVIMLCGKDGKRSSDMEWRIYDSDDVLRFSSLRQQILHICFGWRLTLPLLQQQILCWYFVWHLMEIICFGF